ncbi:MAG TPA: hypothetical protein DCZ04_07395 [Syntrophorhabdus aromaticivorans]|nr:hypothetical protein [Syntrophorhabdus aromaticivorans]
MRWLCGCHKKIIQSPLNKAFHLIAYVPGDLIVRQDMKGGCGVNSAVLSPGISNIFVGLLMIALCIPLLKCRIPMNQWYGVRFSKSFESTENWYKINKYGAGRMIFWSILIIVIGVMALFIPLHGKRTLQAAMACAPLLLIIPVIESWLFARKLKSDN